MSQSPVYINARDRNRTTRHPEEDLRLEYPCNEFNPAEADWEVHFQPKRWAAMRPQQDDAPKGVFDSTSNGSYFDTSSPEKVRIKVPHSDLRDWSHKTMYLTFIVDDGEDRWELDTITVNSRSMT